jgi:hypothetical protein
VTDVLYATPYHETGYEPTVTPTTVGQVLGIFYRTGRVRTRVCRSGHGVCVWRALRSRRHSIRVGGILWSRVRAAWRHG